MLEMTARPCSNSLEGMSTTFGQRVRWCIDEHFGGNQSALARKITEMGRRTTPAAIGHLLHGGKGKPARGSTLTPFIAQASRVHAEWLASGNPPRDLDGEQAAMPVRPKIELTTEIEGVELTRAAIDVAKAFMKLPEDLREDYKRKIETEALRYAAKKPDSELRHLAAPKPEVALPAKGIGRIRGRK
jgi:hypothetical protein